MRVSSVLLFDEDADYVERLCAIASGPPFADKLQVAGFADRERAYAYLMQSDRPVVIAASASAFDWLREAAEANGGARPVYVELLEHPHAYESSSERLYKYQSAVSLLNGLLRAAEQTAAPIRTPTSGKTCRIWGVASATGGAGRSTLALNLAFQAAHSGKRVLLLNLEATESFPFIQPGLEFGCGLSRLVFEARGREGITAAAMSDSIGSLPGIAWDIVYREAGFRELEEMKGSDVSAILRACSSDNRYDVIVIDTDSPGHERTRQALTECDTILWLVRDDAVSLWKTTALFEEFRRMEEADIGRLLANGRFVRSRFTGKPIIEFAKSGFTIFADLPYVPAWKQVDGWEALLHDPVYQAGTAALLELLTTEDEVRPI